MCTCRCTRSTAACASRLRWRRATRPASTRRSCERSSCRARRPKASSWPFFFPTARRRRRSPPPPRPLHNCPNTWWWRSPMPAPTPRNPNVRVSSELATAIGALRPFFVKSAWFTAIASLLVLAPSWYMLEVYDRVVNSRSHMTLAMLTLMVLIAYAVMEVLEWAHGEEMQEAGLALDRSMGDRIFRAIFRANLGRIPCGSVQPLNDLRTLRDFLPSTLLKALVEAPVALVFLVLVFAISS